MSDGQIESTSSAQNQSPPPQDRLDDLGKQLAGGLAVVSAVLGFVGAKEGGLDRILRNDPQPAMLFFFLIGFGVVAGLIVPAVKSKRKVSLGLVVVALTLLAAGSAAYLTIKTSKSRGPKAIQPSWWLFAFPSLLAAFGLVPVVMLAWNRYRRNHPPQVLLKTGERQETTRRPARRMVFGIVIMSLALLGLTVFMWYEKRPSLSFVLTMVAVSLVVLIAIRLAGSHALGIKPVILIAGGVAFSTGLFGMLTLAVESKSTVNRPFVSASLTSDGKTSMLEAHVVVEGLTNQQHVLIRIEGALAPSSPFLLADGQTGRIAAQPEKPEDRACVLDQKTLCQLLGAERDGGDSDGKVDVTIKVPIGEGLYGRVNVAAVVRDDDTNSFDACGEATPKQGCASVFLPPAPTHPTITAEWDDATPPRLKVAAALAGLAADDAVLVRVFDPTAPATPLALAWAGPDQNGAVAESLPVTIGNGVSSVCVRADVVIGGSLLTTQRATIPKATCDASIESASGSVLLVSVPASASTTTG